MSSDENKPPLHEALTAVPKSRQYLANELRMMADGGGAYARIARMSPWAAHVWREAAKIIDGDETEIRGGGKHGHRKR